MANKKKQEIHPGARVRVADPLHTGDERWTQAQAGVVQKITADGLLILLDGETRADYHLWTDVDVERKPRPQLLDLPIIEIHPSRWQYRHTWDQEQMIELARSIQSHGLLNRLLVFRDEDGGYELIAGERRLRAAWALALLHGQRYGALADAVAAVAAADFWSAPPSLAIDQAETIPVELRSGTAADFREIVILENLQRADPSPIEEAEAFQLLIKEDGYTQDSLAKRLSKSQPYVSQRLSLLGLSEPLKAKMQDGEIGFASARALAGLPAAMQPAVAGYVAALDAKSDNPLTTRQVQNIARLAREFVLPDHWTVVEDPQRPMLPVVRNRLRALRWAAEHFDPARTDQVIGLYKSGYQDNNLLARKPHTIAETEWDVYKVVEAMTGVTRDRLWQTIAEDTGRSCAACQMRVIEAPDPMDNTLCVRWTARLGAGEKQITTCDLFIGDGDPLTLSVSSNFAQRAKAAGHGARLHLGSGFEYAASHADYKAILLVARAHERSERDEQRRRTEQSHLKQMWEYWQQQDGPRFDLDHPQAHPCTACYNYRPELLPGLPPCRFAEAPIRDRVGARPVPPGYGALVRRDGLMVPRCDRFRFLTLPEIAPLPGVTIAKKSRTTVLGWAERLLSGGNGRHNTMAGVLAWIPYPRDTQETHNNDALIRWLRDHWDELGDERIARLIENARAEGQAISAFRGALHLPAPGQSEIEDWQSVNFRVAAGFESWWYDHGYPDDWPKPWKKDAKPQEDAPADSDEDNEFRIHFDDEEEEEIEE